MNEAQWVKSLVPRLKAAVGGLAVEGMQVAVEVGWRLAYGYEVLQYDAHGPHKHHSVGYQTDLLIRDLSSGGDWVPRLVIECKIKSVTTHDALTYSAKAATHKQVHPYLRYGLLVGDSVQAVPPRLARHGAFFDFIAVWQREEPSEAEWGDLVRVLTAEVRASRMLQQLLTDRSAQRQTYRLLHRPLNLTPTES